MSDQSVNPTPAPTAVAPNPEPAPTPAPAPAPAPSFTPLTSAQIAEHIGEHSLLRNGTVMNHFAEFAGAHKLGPEAVQAFSKFENHYLQGLAHQLSANDDATFGEWRAGSERDPTLIGGDGWERNLSAIQRVTREYGGELNQESGSNEFMDLLNSTGVGDHPAVLKFLLNISKAIPGEGSPAGGNPGGAGLMPLAERFFNAPRQGG